MSWNRSKKASRPAKTFGKNPRKKQGPADRVGGAVDAVANGVPRKPAPKNLRHGNRASHPAARRVGRRQNGHPRSHTSPRTITMSRTMREMKILASTLAPLNSLVERGCAGHRQSEHGGSAKVSPTTGRPWASSQSAGSVNKSHVAGTVGDPGEPDARPAKHSRLNRRSRSGQKSLRRNSSGGTGSPSSNRFIALRRFQIGPTNRLLSRSRSAITSGSEATSRAMQHRLRKPRKDADNGLVRWMAQDLPRSITEEHRSLTQQPIKDHASDQHSLDFLIDHDLPSSKKSHHETSSSDVRFELPIRK